MYGESLPTRIRNLLYGECLLRIRPSEQRRLCYKSSIVGAQGTATTLGGNSFKLNWTYASIDQWRTQEISTEVLIGEVVLTSAAYLSTPKDSVAVIGDRVELECSTSIRNLSLHWSYSASSNPQQLNYLFNGLKVSDAYASTYEVGAFPDSGRYNLIIKSAGFPYAGEYLCSEDQFNQGAAVAFLTVIASDPVCDANVNPLINGTVENDELWAWCELTYIGKAIPQMKWTFGINRNVTINEKTVNSTKAVSTFTSMIKMQVNSSAYSILISCKTIFELRELPERTRQDKTLKYEYNWNHTASASSFIEDTNEAEARGIPNLLFRITVIASSTVALILVLIIAIFPVSRACCKATEMRQSVAGNLEILEVDNQPTIQINIDPYSEVDASRADKAVKPSESLGAGLDTGQSCVHRNTNVEPRERVYAKLGRSHGDQEKEAYTQLRLYASTASTSEQADYIEIP